VAEAAVAEHVDDYRLLELLAEFGGDLGGKNHGFGIIAIGMENRRLDHLGHIGGVGRRPGEMRAGGKADLVVDDEMNGTAGAVAAEPRQAETFSHNTLPGKGRIAMDEQGQYAFPLAVAALVLLGAGLAQHHRIDDFEMGGIGGQRQMNRVVVKHPVGGRSQMVFYVA